MTPPVLTIEGLEDWARASLPRTGGIAYLCRVESDLDLAEHEGADDDDNH